MTPFLSKGTGEEERIINNESGYFCISQGPQLCQVCVTGQAKIGTRKVLFQSSFFGLGVSFTFGVYLRDCLDFVGLKLGVIITALLLR
ncbi:unnamed protein product [Ixodes pacificus]